MLNGVTTIAAQTGKSLHWICDTMIFPYNSVLRWMERNGTGRAVLKRPGPSFVPEINMDKLKEELTALRHGRKRSKDSSKLYGRYSGKISRSDFSLALKDIRAQSVRTELANMDRITWHEPGLCWAMDATEYITFGKKVYIQQLTDSASNYRFPAISGDSQPHGEEIAAHLDYLFCKYGAPLFLKRDNGGNQKHICVNDVLAKHAVIAIDSPCYYPQYNGSIEKNQDVMKLELKRLLQDALTRPGEHFEVYLNSAINNLNHDPKRRLKGINSCRAYFGYDKKKYYKNERRNIYNWILEQTASILKHMEKQHSTNQATAFRVACTTWLRNNSLITVSKKEKVLPIFLKEILKK